LKNIEINMRNVGNNKDTHLSTVYEISYVKYVTFCLFNILSLCTFVYFVLLLYYHAVNKVYTDVYARSISDTVIVH